MTFDPKKPTREEVLYSFAVEPEQDTATLIQYMREYPNFAFELADLSRELSRSLYLDQDPISAKDKEILDAARQKFFQSKPEALNDPLKSISLEKYREVAKNLEIPFQVLLAFCEKRVQPESVPMRLLKSLASTLECSAKRLVDSLSVAPALQHSRSYKSDSKPRTSKVTFERLLNDAGVSEARRAILMADSDE